MTTRTTTRMRYAGRESGTCESASFEYELTKCTQYQSTLPLTSAYFTETGTWLVLPHPYLFSTLPVSRCRRRRGPVWQSPQASLRVASSPDTCLPAPPSCYTWAQTP